MNREVVLPSGKKLVITPAPFAEAKKLWKACLEELKSIKVDPEAELDVEFLKGLFCAGFSSEKVETALAVCMKRATIDGIKVNEEMFEDVDSRGDYVQVCLEVAMENVGPFLKGLFAQSSSFVSRIEKDLGSK